MPLNQYRLNLLLKKANWCVFKTKSNQIKCYVFHQKSTTDSVSFLSLLRWRYFMTFYSRSFCILLQNFLSFASFDNLFADFWIYTQTFYATSKYPYVKCVVDKGNNKTRAHSHARRKLAIKTSVSISTVCCCCCCFLEQSIRQTSLGFTISLLFVSKIRL